MKALVCLLFVPAALALWVLGSPHVAWRVIAAFRRHRAPATPADDLTYRLLRVGATLALFSLMLIVVLISTNSD